MTQPSPERSDQHSTRALAVLVGLILLGTVLAMTMPADAVPAPDAGPNATIAVEGNPVAPGEPVTLDASDSTAPWALGALYAWDVDDDDDWEFDDACCHTGSLEHRAVDVAFERPGVHPVRLHFTDHRGETDVAHHRVAVSVDGENEAPEAAVYVADPDPRLNASVEIRSTSRDADGRIAEHRWDLDGDGAHDDATGPNVTVEFVDTDDDAEAEQLDGAVEHDVEEDVEEHEVSVVAVDDSGDYDTAGATVEPLDGEDRSVDRDDNLYAPSARFAVRAGGDGVTVNETVALDAGNSSDDAGLVGLYAWDVDDDGDWERNGPAADDGDDVADWEHHGSLGLRTVDVSFDEPGVHPVTLRVEDDHGAIDLVERPIHVAARDAPEPSAPSIERHAPPNGDAVELTAVDPADAEVTEYEWDTDGDGITDTMGPTATATTGTNVSLKITTADGGVAWNATTLGV